MDKMHLTCLCSKHSKIDWWMTVVHAELKVTSFHHHHHFCKLICRISKSWNENSASYYSPKFNRCGMGPLLVHVSPCFRETVVVTCKIGSFLCSLDDLRQKNVIVFFFENQISKWRPYEKRAIFDLLFTFFSYQGKVTKNPLAYISLTYIHVFCSPYWLFFALPILKKNTNLSGMVSLWYDSWCWFLFALFWNNQ